MKLITNFNELNACAKEMGGMAQDFVLTITKSEIDRIDIALKTGVEIGLKDIEHTKNGLLSYKNRQVLLYIQDHGFKIDDALLDGSSGNKFHIAYCKTLEGKNKDGTYERYVATNDTTNDFFINGSSQSTRQLKEGYTLLKVCKNCLKHLEYKNYNYGKTDIFNKFSLDEFFKEYRTHFKHLPSRKAGEDKDGIYSADWKTTSEIYRDSVNWTCESCRIRLAEHKKLLHTHHKNGVKTNNSPNNLEALCAECHANQRNHHHMKITYKARQTLDLLRRQQGL